MGTLKVVALIIETMVMDFPYKELQRPSGVFLNYFQDFLACPIQGGL